jgi:methionyl-tRNA formyltransferase
MKIFMFHDIINPKTESLSTRRLEIKGLLHISQFEEKIDYLQKKYTFLSLKDFYKKNYDEANWENYCILTFDDGLKNQYANAYPVLKKRGIPAAFFISGCGIQEHFVTVTHKIQFLLYECDINLIFEEVRLYLEKKVGNVLDIWNEKSKTSLKNNTWNSKQIFLTNILRENENRDFVNELFQRFFCEPRGLNESEISDLFYMNRAEIEELRENGMDIGGHGFYHEFEKDSCEMRRIRDFMSDLCKSDFFYSYPNGKIDNQIREFCSIGLTTENRSVNNTDDLLLLPRINCVNIPNTKKIVLCGVQQQGLDICKFLINNNIHISCLVTISRESSEKNRASGWVDYSQFAKDHDIQLYLAKSYTLKTDQDLLFFKEQSFDILLLGGWQRLLPENILHTLRFGAIGQHGSSELLPRGRGRSPINWSILMNRKRIIWNIFFITPGIDDGDIIDCRVIEITPHDTVETIYYKVSIIIKQMYLECIPKIFAGSLVLKKQVGLATFYERRTEEDGRIDWKKSVHEIYNLVRCVTKPYPGAYTTNGLSKIKIWKAQPFDQNILYTSSALGEVVEIFENGDYLVNCCDGTLLITNYSGGSVYIGDQLS